MSEYEITEDGITLTTPWQDADHLNVRTESGTVNFHAEAKCAAIPAPPECSPIMQTAAQKIGQNFISWDDLGINPESCIEWVQFSRANYHFGEQGEAPLCLTTPPVVPEPEPETPPTNVVPTPPAVDVPPSIEVPTSTPASVDELAVTGGTDFFPIVIAAAALMAAGGLLLRKAFAR